MTELVVSNVQKWLGGLQILKGASFTAQRGSIVALLGGKSPSDLLAQLVKGTPLSRTVDGMRVREEDGKPQKPTKS